MEEEGCPMLTFCGQGDFQMRTSALRGAKKTSNFSKFMACPQGGRGIESVQTFCGQGASIFAILCGRLLWMEKEKGKGKLSTSNA